jgi:hypothetical protein
METDRRITLKLLRALVEITESLMNIRAALFSVHHHGQDNFAKETDELQAHINEIFKLVRQMIEILEENG